MGRYIYPWDFNDFMVVAHNCLAWHYATITAAIIELL